MTHCQRKRFTNRKQLLKVAKLGPKAFEQCAGFMRIANGDNPLDATSVHPESYDVAKKLLGKEVKDYKKLAEELGVGEITLRDIVKELEKVLLRCEEFTIKDLQ